MREIIRKSSLKLSTESKWGNQFYQLLLLGAVLFTSCFLMALQSHKQHYQQHSHNLLRTPRFLENDNTTCSLKCCKDFHEESVSCTSENEWIQAIPFWLQIVIIIILLVASALFSGLTLGLMSLDCTGLEIVMEGDDEVNAAAARRIYSVRKNGNLLLCTLLLGNVCVNAFLSILMGELFGGIPALIGSTILIVILGEIMPQALCSRYALQIGSFVVPLVRVLVCIMYPFAFPLAFALDKLLGQELATTYSSGEMRKLLEIHVKEGRFDQEVGTAMTGALNYKELKVKEVMTPASETFMLNVDTKLDFTTIAQIFKTGYSRIPVYEVDQNNIIGLLFVKDLIFIDPEDETPVRNFCQIFGRGVHVVWPDDNLGDVLRELKKGKSHMALVRDVNGEAESQDPFYEIKGIITLEDIIEEILGDEIVDETDAASQKEVSNARVEFDWGRLRLLDANFVEQYLSEEEGKAVMAHLQTNYAHLFSTLSNEALSRLVTETEVESLEAATLTVGQDLPNDLLYEQGATTDVCTLILGGKVTVLAGKDKFKSEVSSWSVLGGQIFQQSEYQPDFSAYVSHGPCRVLRFTKVKYEEVTHTATNQQQELQQKQSEDRASKSQALLGTSVDKSKEVLQSRRHKLIAAMQQDNVTKKQTGDFNGSSTISFTDF
mmetsp:Transcript_22161/g.33501  ORF Transcript_22161/g.33501 Transcript_22161/m.33501 type:complete len:661 (-) Transcript_22161:44-2026(-)